MHGVTKRPSNVFVLYASDIGRVPREGMSPGPYTLGGLIYRNLKIYRYNIIQRYTEYQKAINATKLGARSKASHA
jgi:hypothetical protein